MKVTCLKCGLRGSLTKKKTISKGRTYEYWYVEHHRYKKIKWCYLGKMDKLPAGYKEMIYQKNIK